jgi:starvation-inducible outer membrane lipoprotein
MRSTLVLLTLLAACRLATAQAPVQESAPADPRQNQKIERIVIQDEGSRVEEVRVGGQTQSVKVQPGGTLPAYEMQPDDLARSRPGDRRDGLSGGGGQRVWNVLNF